MLQNVGGKQILELLEQERDGKREPGESCIRDVTHLARKLTSEKSENRRQRTQRRVEDNEERKLFVRVHRNVVKFR